MQRQADLVELMESAQGVWLYPHGESAPRREPYDPEGWRFVDEDYSFPIGSFPRRYHASRFMSSDYSIDRGFVT